MFSPFLSPIVSPRIDRQVPPQQAVSPPQFGFRGRTGGRQRGGGDPLLPANAVPVPFGFRALHACSRESPSPLPVLGYRCHGNTPHTDCEHTLRSPASLASPGNLSASLPCCQLRSGNPSHSLGLQTAMGQCYRLPNSSLDYAGGDLTSRVLSSGCIPDRDINRRCALGSWFSP